MAMPAAPAPLSTTPRLGNALARQLQRVEQGGRHHDGGAVLVVVEHGDIAALP